MRLIDADVMRNEWLENGENEYVYDTNSVLESIDQQPTIEAEPVRHGRWIKNEWILNRVTCSECKCYFDSLESDLYCPNCGAKMDLEG